MKPSKVINTRILNLFSLKKVWLFIFVYSLIIITCFLVIAREGSWSPMGLYDIIANLDGIHGSTNQNMFLILAIPVIVTTITILVDKNEKSLLVIKYSSRFKVWHANVVSGIGFSFLFTCIILIISFLIGGLMVGFSNTWLSSSGTVSKAIHNKIHFQYILSNLATSKIIITLFLTKFFGCLMIVFLTLFLKQFIKKGVLIGIILIVLSVIDLDLNELQYFHFFTMTASLSLPNWINPMLTVYHCVYQLILCLVLYGITGLLYKKKDFYL